MDIHVICAGAARAAVSAAASACPTLEAFEFHYVSGPVGHLIKQIREGEPAHVLVLSRSGMETLAADNGVETGSISALGTTSVGLVMALGRNASSFSDSASLRQFLRQASTVSYGDPAGGDSSGTHFQSVLAQLGLEHEMVFKTVLAHSGADVVHKVASGAADVGATQVSVIKAHPEVAFAGALPPDLQKYTTYCIGIPTGLSSPDRALAIAVADQLTSASAQSVYARLGLEQKDNLFRRKNP
jgi:molybdate transport system substrate-binding protein